MAARFVAFDVETTGLFPESDRLTEVAGLSFDLDGKVTGRFEEFCNPGMPIPEEVVALTGITDAMVMRAPPPIEVVQRFLEFVDGAYLIAHNALFDGSFVANALKREKLPLPDLQLLDTLNWARARLKLRDFKLGTVARYFHLRPKKVHRAAEDAKLAMGVFLHLAKLDKATTPALAIAGGDPFPLLSCLAGPLVLPDELAELPRLIAEKKRVTIVYQGGTQGDLPRPVTPAGLIQIGQFSYLVAFCHRDKKEKQFRLDRIRDLKEPRELRKRAPRARPEPDAEPKAARAKR